MVSPTVKRGSKVMSCSICGNSISKEDAPIIAMGGFGNPRYICDECAEKIEIMTKSRDIDEIKDAIMDIVTKMEKGEFEDKVLLKSVCEILDSAKDRLALIEKGEYDFSLDEAADESDIPEEIPEELLESEEDKAIDELESEEKKKFDKVFNWVALGVFALAFILGLLFVLYF